MTTVPVSPSGVLPAGALRRFAATRTGTGRIPPRPLGQPVPLTPIQQRLWFLDRAGLGGDTYLAWWAERLIGPLQPAALATALGQVVARHEALRTGVVERDGQAYQVATAPDQLDLAGLLARLDLSGTPDADREPAARRWLDTFFSRGFDLARPPLLRAALVRLDVREHVLAIAAHHIVCDGTATGVIVDELYAGYRDLTGAAPAGAAPPGAAPAGRATSVAPPSEPPAGFLDYAAWLAARDPATLAADRDYWRQHLRDTSGTPRLPTDRPRPANPTRRGARHSITLPAYISAAVRELARREQRTTFSIMTAALAAVLVRFGAGDDADPVIGAPASTRDRPELERTVGMFANTVALRVALAGNPRLREVLERASAAVAGALDHAGFPFEQVVELVGAHRDLRQNPLFQTMLVVGPGGEPAPAVGPDLHRTSWPLPALPARFDLTLYVADGDPLGLHLDYATELFDSDTIARLAEALSRLLHALATTPEQRLWEVPLVGTAARSSAVGRPEPGSHPDSAPASVLARFAAQVAAIPAAPAVVTDAGTISYGELAHRADLLAGQLRAAGAGPGTLVGVLLPTGPEAVVAILAALRAGAAYLPLDPTHPPARTEALLAEAGVTVVVTPAGVAGRDGPPPSPTASAGPADPAYTIYTSGSTGRPKGVTVTHRTLARLTDAFIRVHGLGPGTRLLMLPPLTFDASVGDVFPALASGAALVLHPEPARLDGAELVRFCTAHRVTAIDTAVSLWRRWTTDLTADLPPADWPVTMVMVGGDRVPTADVRAWERATGGRTVLFNHYGPTEATVCTLVHRVGPGSDEGTDHLPIGRPLPHVRAYVRDPYGGLAPVGVTGELYLGGDCLAQGYLRQPAQTAQRFRPDPDSPVPGARMYRTGDLARLRADGRVEFLGRVDRQVKIHGHRIEPAEIEAALTAHPEITDAAVVARTEPGDGTGSARLVAYLAGAAPAAGDLRRFLRQRLPDYLVPSAFVHLDRIPRTSHGKIDQAALPAPAAAPESAPPQGPVETGLAEIWARVVEVPQVGRDDNFFDLGGHSLLAAGLFAEIQRRFGVTLPVSCLFDTADLAELAALVAAAADAPGEREPATRQPAVDLRGEAALPDDLRPPARPASASATPAAPPRTVLVTGATGFLGAHLVAQLLDRGPGTVWCLTRAADPAQARQRVLDSLHRYGLTADPQRIVGVPGDLTVPRLGQSEADFAELAGRVDAICHNGGLVNFIEPYQRLRPANVDGTRTILELAVRAAGPGRGVIPVHFVSTLGIYLTETYLPGTVTETDPPDDPSGLHDGYNQSKWVADAMMRQARERGVPVTVHRPARVGADSRTGLGNPDDYFARLLVTCVQVGAVPAVPHTEDVSPVDYVAAGVAHLLLTGARRPPGDHHYFNDRTISYPEIAATLAEHGHPVALVDWPDWRRAVLARRDAGQELALAPFLVTLPDDVPQVRRPTFDCSGTEAVLAAAGITCPAADRALLGRHVDQLAAAGRFGDGPAGGPGAEDR